MTQKPKPFCPSSLLEILKAPNSLHEIPLRSKYLDGFLFPALTSDVGMLIRNSKWEEEERFPVPEGLWRKQTWCRPGRIWEVWLAKPKAV